MPPVSGIAVVSVESAFATPSLPHGSEPRMDPVPALGQHTAAVLTELGHSSAEVDRLRRIGAI